MLKPANSLIGAVFFEQPPSGGCVLKPPPEQQKHATEKQPPSGGCVLKRNGITCRCVSVLAAAFGRLCVETRFGKSRLLYLAGQPPSGGCVLKRLLMVKTIKLSGSRLRAAVC